MNSFLICGLGNIGTKYEYTRHNVGFVLVDHLAKHLGLFWNTDRLALSAEGKFKGRKLCLIKPTTLMNLSGVALKYWLEKKNLPIEQVLVIVDDLNLPFMKFRYRQKGSSGGHNGLKNIEVCLGRQDYPRLRVGIGNDFNKGKQIDFVLDNWLPEQWQNIQEKSPIITEKILNYLVYPQNANHIFQN